MAEGGLGRRLADERFLFVAISTATNLLMLGRSYVAMLTLDERGLGIVTLVQTLVLFVSTLQLGLLQGGYRLLCNGEAEDGRAINNHLYLLFAVLTGLTLAGALAAFLGGTPATTVLLGFIGAVVGVVTLNRNWVNNQLIASQSLAQLNRLTLWSALLSLVPLAAATTAPLAAVIASIALQPLLFVAGALLTSKSLRPTSLHLDRKLSARIFAAGFTLFAAGMLLQANILVERWYVTTALGLEALGHLFLLTLFVTLFQLVPNSLDALFLPRLVAANQAEDHPAVKATLRQFMLWVALYCVAILVVTVLLARPVVELLLPQRAADLRYVYIALPGLLLFALSGPFAIIFNALIRYRPLFLAYGASTILTVAGVLLARAGMLPLDSDGVIILRSVAQAATSLLLVLGWLWLSSLFRQFRFL